MAFARHLKLPVPALIHPPSRKEERTEIDHEQLATADGRVGPDFDGLLVCSNLD
jgi:hypothetical protein